MKRAVAVFVVLSGLVVLPRHALAQVPVVQFSSPEDGAAVGGTVLVSVDTAGPTTSVTFEWSSDGGSTWTAIGTDSTADDGWSVPWDTAGFEGAATLRATATDGVTTGEATEGVTVDNTPPSVRVSASPDAFSPNHDQVKDVATIAVRVTEKAILTVEVRDPQGRSVSTLATNRAVARGVTRFTWKGWHGDKRAPDGTYRVTAVAADQAGNHGGAASKLTLDTTPPAISWRGISPEPVTSSGPVRMAVRIHDRSAPLRIAVSILGDAGLVRQVQASRAAGPASLEVPTRYKSGDPLVPGLYRAEVTATDAAGNASSSSERAFRVLRPVHTTVFRRVEGAGHRVALTFDDCNFHDAWGRILDILEANHVHTTFFCVGYQVRNYADMARRTVALGDSVGNHTWDHADLTGMSEASIRSELNRNAAAWWDVARTTPAPYFRPPYGAYDGAALAAAGSAGYLRTVLWDVDPQDWRRPGASVIVSKVLGAIRPGSIVVMHVQDQTADALPSILRVLQRRGLVQSSLPELFHAAGYR